MNPAQLVLDGIPLPTTQIIVGDALESLRAMPSESVQCIVTSPPYLDPPIEGVPPVDTTTRSEAWALGDGSVVVLVEGKSGGVHLSHVEVLP